MQKSLAVTVIGPDRPGIVNLVSDTAASFGASWQESHMANLAGQFAGIVHFIVSEEDAALLTAAFRKLEGQDLLVTVAIAEDPPQHEGYLSLHLDITGLDQPGMVRDISNLLAQHDISIASFESESFSGSMSGEDMFRARAELAVPAAVSSDTLRDALEGLSHSLMVEVAPQEEQQRT